MDDEPALDRELLAALRRLPSEQGAPSRATDEAVLAMAREHLAGIRPVRHGWWRAIAAAAAMLAIGIFVGMQVGGGNQQPVAKAAAASPDDAKIILREVSELFPGQIRAIERDASGLQLVLADQPRATLGTGVVIEVMEDGRFRQIITFDGQRIELMGQFIEVEATDDGRIHLKGEELEWKSDAPKAPEPNVSIKARVI